MTETDLRDTVAAFLKDRAEMMEQLLTQVGGPEGVSILRRRSHLRGAGNVIGMRYENWLVDEDECALAYMLEEVTRDRMHLDCAVYDKPRAAPLDDPAPLVEGERMLH